MKTNKRKIFLQLCLIGCLSSSIGCDAIYRMLDKEGAQEKELIGEIAPFEVNPTVEEVQTLLKIYGYNIGTPDGVLGSRTRNAVERFQEDTGLEPSRFIDTATWEKLKEFKLNNFIVNGTLNVKKMQKALNASGFDVGQADGKLGKKTATAILKFQEAHGLKADGKVGYKTLTALAQYAP